MRIRRTRLLKEQMIVLALAAVVATCGVAGSALWLMLRDNRAFNTALLNQVKTLSAELRATPVPTPDPEALPPDKGAIRIVATLGDPAGPPAAGLELTLDGAAFGEKNDSIGFTTGRDGRARIGPVRPGHYTIDLRDGGAAYHFAAPLPFILFSGQNLERTIVCPRDVLAAKRELGLAVDWSPDLTGALDLARLGKDEKFYVGGLLEREAPRLGDITWLGQKIGFLATLRGEFTTAVDFAAREDQPPAIGALSAGAFKTRQTLPVGRYLLNSIYFLKGAAGTPVSQMTRFSGSERLPVVIPDNGATTVTIPIPVRFKQAIYAAYPGETTVEMRAKVASRFRDLQFTPERITRGVMLTSMNAKYTVLGSADRREHDVVLQAGKPELIENCEVTLEDVSAGGEGNVAVVKLKYLPAAVAGGSAQKGTGAGGKG